MKKIERWVSHFVGISLAGFAGSTIWLFATERLYEPNIACKRLEMATAGLFTLIGLGWAGWNWIRAYKEES
jgi:hypothetical protein